jgi:hypothetical protein
MRQTKALKIFLGAAAALLWLSLFPGTAAAQRIGRGNEALDLSGARISPPPFPEGLVQPSSFHPEVKPPQSGFTPAERCAWLLLGVAQHGAALFDAHTTREAMKDHRELNPLLRPFAHSAAIYPVMQISPFGIDWLGARLARSRHRWLRRLWWLPQAAATAGFIWSGVHNLRLPASPAAGPR